MVELKFTFEFCQIGFFFNILLSNNLFILYDSYSSIL